MRHVLDFGVDNGDAKAAVRRDGPLENLVLHGQVIGFCGGAGSSAFGRAGRRLGVRTRERRTNERDSEEGLRDRSKTSAVVHNGLTNKADAKECQGVTIRLTDDSGHSMRNSLR